MDNEQLPSIMKKYIDQIDADISYLEEQKAKLIQMKMSLIGSKVTTSVKSQAEVKQNTLFSGNEEEQRKEKIRQAALQRHKRNRDAKIAEINNMLRVRDIMTTKEIAEALEVSRIAATRTLKAGGFKYINVGKWSLPDYPTSTLDL